MTENDHLPDINDQLILNLRDLGHTLRLLYEGKGSQKRILILLDKAGGMTQRELTERLGIRTASASEVVRKLEGAGLITRIPSSEDRRTTDIQLTAAGERMAEEAIRQRKERHQDMFACLSPEERQTLLELLEKLNGDWSGRYTVGSGSPKRGKE